MCKKYLFFIFLLTVVGQYNAQSTKGSRPNIIVIVADDLGYADVGFNRDANFPAEKGVIPTPELDQLANNGIICTNGHVAHPFCGPSRAALMTGVQPSRIGVQYNLPNDINTSLGIPLEETYFPKILQQNNYHTAAFGKWHLGFTQGKYQPLDRGFDYFFGFLGGGKAYFEREYEDLYYRRLGGSNPVTNEYQDPLQRQRDYVAKDEFNQDEYLTDILTDEAINYIAENKTKSDPFFMYVAYNAPHTPLQAPAEEIAQFKEENPNFESLVRNSDYLKESGAYELDKVERELKKVKDYDYNSLSSSEKEEKVADYREHLLDKFTESRIVYATMVSNMDKNIGRIVAELKKDQKVFDNTMIVFLSDNGGYTYSKGAVNHPLYALKGSVFEGGHRVPFFIHWPNKIKSPKKYKYQISSLDLYPTLVDLAGASVPSTKKLDGLSFMDKVLDNKQIRPNNDPIYVLRPLFSFHAVAINSNPYKAVKRSKNSKWELYNIETDPGETNNLANTNSDVVKELKAKGVDFVKEFKNVKPLWFDHERNGGHPHRSLWFSTEELPNYDGAFGTDELSLSVLTNYKNKKMRLYPNPSEGKYTVDFQVDYQELEVRLFATTGQWVATMQVSKENPVLNMSHLSSGNYIALFSGGNEISVEQLIKL
ncbi:sulfatase-like hydrolase/transferase [Ochrovirga pacifica]|uniref:sulfatase-like hydrolase/transferase n=1 Tax=Ochrovirga pacifica TaxID=1042376 RepID=UPI0002557BC1|nr:sulfatase-like hydrolase/transferase [Ochrovirga pacifica]